MKLRLYNRGEKGFKEKIKNIVGYRSGAQLTYLCHLLNKWSQPSPRHCYFCPFILTGEKRSLPYRKFFIVIFNNL